MTTTITEPYLARSVGRVCEIGSEIEVEGSDTKSIAAGGAYASDVHVKMQYTLCCRCLYLPLLLSLLTSLSLSLVSSSFSSSPRPLASSLSSFLNPPTPFVFCLSPSMSYFHASTELWRQHHQGAYWYSSESSYQCLSLSLSLVLSLCLWLSHTYIHKTPQHGNWNNDNVSLSLHQSIATSKKGRQAWNGKCEADGLRRKKKKGVSCAHVSVHMHVWVSFTLLSCLYFVHRRVCVSAQDRSGVVCRQISCSGQDMPVFMPTERGASS